MPSSFRRLPLLIVPLALALDSAAQPQDAPPPRTLTAADYARAEKFMGYNTNPLVYHAVHPAWTTGELLWYRDAVTDGTRFVLFDPAKLTKEPAFDHARLAAALSAAAGRKYEANKLPFNAIELSADGASISFSISFQIGAQRYRCDRQGSQCAVEQGGRNRRPWPDRCSFAGQEEDRLHPRIQPVGARYRNRQGDPAYDRRRQGQLLRAG